MRVELVTLAGSEPRAQGRHVARHEIENALSPCGDRGHRCPRVARPRRDRRDAREEPLERRLRVLLRARERSRPRVRHARLVRRAPDVREDAELDRLERRRRRELLRDPLIDRRASEQTRAGLAREHAAHAGRVVVEVGEVDSVADHDVALYGRERLEDAAGRKRERRPRSRGPVLRGHRAVRRKDDEEALRRRAGAGGVRLALSEAPQRGAEKERESKADRKVTSRDLHGSSWLLGSGGRGSAAWGRLKQKRDPPQAFRDPGATPRRDRRGR